MEELIEKSESDFNSEELLPPGTEAEDNKLSDEYRPRSSSRDYDRPRRERSRERRYDRDDRRDGPHDSFSSRNSQSSRDYDRRSYRDHYRDRSRDHNRDRPRDRSRDRDRDRNKELDWKEEIPHNTILMKGLGPQITESDIRNEIVRYSLYPKDIILMRKKHTGESRGFAFVEFRLLSDAVRWKELTRGVIFFGQFRATLHYFVAKDIPGDRLANKSDWTCTKCGLNNFRKRDLCFKCNAPREECQLDQRSEGCEEVSNSPSSTLLFRNLDILTTEERVLSMLGQLTVLPIKNLKVAKDILTNTSRGFAYVELHSVSEAMQLHDLLLSMAGNFYVDGRQVTVSYSHHSLSVMNSAASANAASAALAAAQWTNQNVDVNDTNYLQYGDTSNTLQSNNGTFGNNSNHSINNNAAHQQYSTPDVSAYQYDESSGYYYDAITGFYYDSNSQYYYNSETQKYLYWDAEKSTYLPVATSGSAVIEAPSVKASNTDTQVSISSPPVIAHAPVLTTKKEAEPPQEKQKEKSAPQDKVKIAKKVAKEMEKWAKTLNQKKEIAKMSFMTNVVPPPQIDPPQEDFVKPETSFISFEKKRPVEKLFPDVFKSEQREPDDKKLPTSSAKDKASLTLIAAYGGESDSEPEAEAHEDIYNIEDLVKYEEAKLIDWTKLACLLCKRQFPTKEVLTKHTQFSDLHKQNVDMLKLSKLSSRQLVEQERRETGYRDRAKERREKFGQPDIPPPNRLKTKYMKERKDVFIPPEEPTKAGIGSDNIGNKMLKAMGWTEGQGLGKSGQGMSGIIEVQQRVKSAGLGMKGASYGAGSADSYKDAVRKAMQARYNEIA